MVQTTNSSCQITVPSHSVLKSMDFTYGVSTSALQIEGGRDGREQNIWDSFCAQNGTIADGSNANVACAHYTHWQKDIELLKQLEVDAYRFSIAWPRVIRADGQLNQTGLDFYRRLLDGLATAELKSFVTLYHWDLPQYLEDKGGWLNRDTAHRFQDYTHKVCESLNGLVTSYATLNEPFCSAYIGYYTGQHAPGQRSAKACNQAAHHLLLAHGLGMQVLREVSPDTHNGVVINVSPTYPNTPTQADKQAAVTADKIINHWYLMPILEGCYPDLIDSINPEYVPVMQSGDMDIIATEIDYLGINYYTRTVVESSDNEAYQVVAPSTDAEVTDMGWEVFPEGLTRVLADLNDSYDLPPIYITESGAAMADTLEQGEVNDDRRIDYYQRYLTAVHDASEQGVNILGYFAWSLMDNFEWADGYSKRFGLVYVDYTTQQRIIKKSGYCFRDFIADRNSGSGTI